MKYNVYFEYYGHRYQMIVFAENPEKAKERALERVKDKITFDKVKLIGETPDFLKDIFNFH